MSIERKITMTIEEIRIEQLKQLIKDKMRCHLCTERCELPDPTVLPQIPKDATVVKIVPCKVTDSDIWSLEEECKAWNEANSISKRSVVWHTAEVRECEDRMRHAPYVYEAKFNAMIIEQHKTSVDRRKSCDIGCADNKRIESKK